MTRGDKIALSVLLVFGILVILLGSSFKSGPHITGEVIVMGNALMIVGALFIAGASTALITSYLKLKRTYQGAILMIFIGAVLSAIPMVQTYGAYGYDFSFTTFPLSFIGYPLIGVGSAIIVYSYFTSHLRFEMVQSKEADKTISTARVVWRENNAVPTSNLAQGEADANQQLMQQHMFSAEIEDETAEDVQAVHYCRYCGNANKYDAVYCEKCGKNIA